MSSLMEGEMMESQSKSLETTGPNDWDVDRGCYSDHLFAYIGDDGKIFMQADFYNPPAGEWKEDEWISNSCFLSGKATRSNWKLIFSIGRALVRHGQIAINQPGKDPLIVECDGSKIQVE